jgi:hypothetical protein
MSKLNLYGDLQLRKPINFDISILNILKFTIGTYISTNVNFSERGRLYAHLYKDAIRLSSEGVSVLAANIKRTLLGKGLSPSVRYSRQTHLQKPNFSNLNNRPGNAVHRTN